MKRLLAPLLVALSLFAPAAQAQLFRAYLSPTGNDSNPCTLPSPCRLLPAALAAVADGGEVWMLDSANYNAGTVAITKSVTILAVPGAVGSVVSIGNGAPAVQIATVGLRVALRNLVVAPVSGAGSTFGIVVSSSAVVSIEDSVISGFSDQGLQISNGAEVALTNSVVRNVTGEGAAVLGTAKLAVGNTRFIGNGTGLLLSSPSAGAPRATVVDSVFSKNGTGVASQNPLGNGDATLTRVLIEGSTSYAIRIQTGVQFGFGSVTMNAVTLSYNAGGWFLSGFVQTLESKGNNLFIQNGTSQGGLFTTALQ